MQVSSLDSAITRGRSSWQCGIRSQVHDGIEPVLVDPVNPQTDELIDRKILHPARLQMGDEVRRHSMNAHGYELVRGWMGITELLKLADKLRRYAVNPERDQFVQFQVIVAFLFQLLDPFRRRAVNSHGDEFVRVRRVTGLFKTADHLRRYAVDSKGDEFIAVRKIQARRPDLRNKRR